MRAAPHDVVLSGRDPVRGGEAPVLDALAGDQVRQRPDRLRKPGLLAADRLSPCRRYFCAERALPAGVRGPCRAARCRRLAAILSAWSWRQPLSAPPAARTAIQHTRRVNDKTINQVCGIVTRQHAWLAHGILLERDPSLDGRTMTRVAIDVDVAAEQKDSLPHAGTTEARRARSRPRSKPTPSSLTTSCNPPSTRCRPDLRRGSLSAWRAMLRSPSCAIRTQAERHVSRQPPGKSWAFTSSSSRTDCENRSHSAFNASIKPRSSRIEDGAHRTRACTSLLVGPGLLASSALRRRRPVCSSALFAPASIASKAGVAPRRRAVRGQRASAPLLRVDEPPAQLACAAASERRRRRCS